MKFNTKDVVTELRETSKSRDDGCYLLDSKYKNMKVYHFDAIKKVLCNHYRKKQELGSCDAYYEEQNHRNSILIEFKNTAHERMKEFWNSFDEKAFDSHMILLETFWNNGKVKKIAENTTLLIVYNDQLNYENAIVSFNRNLNKVEPLKGSTKRNSKTPELFESEEEYEEAKKKFVEKFKGDFYKEVEFMEKKDFEEFYLKRNYFNHLFPNENIIQ